MRWALPERSPTGSSSWRTEKSWRRAGLRKSSPRRSRPGLENFWRRCCKREAIHLLYGGSVRPPGFSDSDSCILWIFPRINTKGRAFVYQITKVEIAACTIIIRNTYTAWLLFSCFCHKGFPDIFS